MKEDFLNLVILNSKVAASNAGAGMIEPFGQKLPRDPEGFPLVVTPGLPERMGAIVSLEAHGFSPELDQPGHPESR